MGIEPQANFIAGEFGPAARGARFSSSARRAESWPQSSSEDVAEAGRAAASACAAWRALAAARRGELVCAMARELERDSVLGVRLGERFQLDPAELALHFAGLEHGLGALFARPASRAGGVAWCAPDWRELVRAPLVDLARELYAGRTAVLISDARLPEVAERFAVAAHEAGLPAGVLGLLHGATKELVTLALASSREHGARAAWGAAWGEAADDASAASHLVASGPVARMVELRRLCERQGLADPRLRALRCGTFEVSGQLDSASALAEQAGVVVAGAFGRGTTLTGQLPGALGRVFCPARLFSRFSELLLERLETDAAARAPVPQIDEEASARVRAACELGLDEGATCIAGGVREPDGDAVPPTLFTNVETYMASARRQDPLPVLCLLRGS